MAIRHRVNQVIQLPADNSTEKKMSNVGEVSGQSESSQSGARKRTQWAVEVTGPRSRIDRLATHNDHWIRAMFDDIDELQLISLDPAVSADAARDYSETLIGKINGLLNVNLGAGSGGT
jgi:hypothetical protein